MPGALGLHGGNGLRELSGRPRNDQDARRRLWRVVKLRVVHRGDLWRTRRRVGRGSGVPWKGHLDPVGGRKPTRQLTFQPEAVEATRQSDLPVEALDAKGSPGRISERADHNEN